MNILSNETDALEYRALIDDRLQDVVESFSTQSQALNLAMAGSVSPTGKRFRGTLMLLIGAQTGEVSQALIDAATAVEIFHAASLIIDDLPAMDNANLRRGQPAIHKVYGEDTAILAGIALVVDAIGFLASSPNIKPEMRSELIAIMTHATGSHGLCAGQELDLHAEKSSEGISLEQDLKTGALFLASLQMIGVIQALDADGRKALAELGLMFGRVFQSCDDLKDAFGDETALGKDVGKDADVRGVKNGVLAISNIPDAIAHYEGERARLFENIQRLWPDASDLVAYIDAVMPNFSSLNVKNQDTALDQSSPMAG